MSTAKPRKFHAAEFFCFKASKFREIQNFHFLTGLLLRPILFFVSVFMILFYLLGSNWQDIKLLF